MGNRGYSGGSQPDAKEDKQMGRHTVMQPLSQQSSPQGPLGVQRGEGAPPPFTCDPCPHSGGGMREL